MRQLLEGTTMGASLRGSELITEFAQQFLSLLHLLLAFHSFGAKSIDHSQDTSPLFGFGYDDFDRIGSCAINGANFLTHLDSIEDVDRIGLPQNGKKRVARSHSFNILHGRLNQIRIISFTPD